MRHGTIWRGALGALTVIPLLLAPAAAGALEHGGKGSNDPAPLGTYAVGRVTETFVDDTRPTPPFGTYAGAPDRTLETVIFYPARGEYVEDEIVDDARPATKDAPYPLILFSHGLTANATVYEGVINEWVSAGYVVAAPNYPLSNTDAPGGSVGGSGLSDVSHQPADASFVIDEVLALSRTKGSPLRGMVNRKHIGASGHSLGGITTLGLTYADCCIDDRIDAAAPMSGLAGLIAEGSTYFQGTDTPLLVLHGDMDPTVPYSTGVDAYTRAEGPKFLVTFTGAGHVLPFVGADGPQGDVLVASSLAFWDRYLKGDRDALHQLDEVVSDPSIATLEEQVRPT